MALTAVESETIAVLLLVFGVFLVGLWLLRRRLAERRKQLKGEIAESEARTEERAHNQLVLDEAELKTLEREGFDVGRPRGALSEAQAAFARRDFHHALSIGRSVHDQLVRLRQTGPEGSPGELSGPTPSSGRTGGPSQDGRVGPPDDGAPSDGAVRPALPRNRMESRFQIGLLTEELVVAVRSRPEAPEVVEANRLAREASARANEEQYTEALRLSLRARRLLGGKVEALPPPRGTTVPASEGPQGPGPGRPTAADPAPSETAGTSSNGACPRCRRPLRAGDVYCRSCGAPIAPSKCPRCSTPLDPDDRFCARCGAPSG